MGSGSGRGKVVSTSKLREEGKKTRLLSLEFLLFRDTLSLSCSVVLSVGTEEVVEVSEGSRVAVSEC